MDAFLAALKGQSSEGPVKVEQVTVQVK
jgi:hypothetical protein